MLAKSSRSRFGREEEQCTSRAVAGGIGRGRGRRGRNKPGSGPGRNCLCPRCGHKIPDRAARPSGIPIVRSAGRS